MTCNMAYERITEEVELGLDSLHDVRTDFFMLLLCRHRNIKYNAMDIVRNFPILVDVPGVDHLIEQGFTCRKRIPLFVSSACGSSEDAEYTRNALFFLLVQRTAAFIINSRKNVEDYACQKVPGIVVEEVRVRIPVLLALLENICKNRSYITECVLVKLDFFQRIETGGLHLNRRKLNYTAEFLPVTCSHVVKLAFRVKDDYTFRV